MAEKRDQRPNLPRGRYKKYLMQNSTESESRTPIVVSRQTRWSQSLQQVHNINIFRYF